MQFENPTITVAFNLLYIMKLLCVYMLSHLSSFDILVNMQICTNNDNKAFVFKQLTTTFVQKKNIKDFWTSAQNELKLCAPYLVAS